MRTRSLSLPRWPIHRLLFLRLTPSALGLRWSFVLGSVFAFGTIAAHLHRRGSLECDDRSLEWLHRHRDPRLTRVMLGATVLGSAGVLTTLSLLVSVALWASRQRRAALFLAFAAAGSTLINQTLKLSFGRARPDSRLHLSRTTGFAFPSGHSMSSAAIYGALAIVVARQYPKLESVANGAAGLLVLAVGGSRAYLHVHYCVFRAIVITDSTAS